MDVRSLGFRTDLMVRRLAGSTVTERDGYLVVRSPHNPSFYWGNFLLFPSAPHAGELEMWLASFRAEFPAADFVALGVDGSGGFESSPELAASGLELDLGTVLAATDLEASKPPVGRPTLRELRSDDDWSEAYGLRLDLSRDEGPTPGDHGQFLQRSTDEARALVEGRHGAYFGAFVGERLASMLGIVSDGDGVARFQNVATHPEYRRRGLASHLVVRAGEYGRSQLGAHTLVIVADADAPAADLYRSVGFEDQESQVGLFRPQSD